MRGKSAVFTRKKALLLLIICSLVLLGLIFLRWQAGSERSLMTTEGRERFLSSLGWEIDPESESYKSVVLPRELDGVLAEYNKMQLEQGYDLREHLGEKCQQYSYIIKNYPGTDSTVYLSLYLQGRKVIAGDIHTSSVNGFMHGIKKQN